MCAYILGTAQLGMVYGIANVVGQPNMKSAYDIIGLALEKGITHFDTAQGYGCSERVLGACLQKLRVEAKIITKLVPDSLLNKRLLLEALEASMRSLAVSSLYCFMLHHEESLLLLDAWQGDVLREQQSLGNIEHIGISVYSPEWALRALDSPLVQIVQIPSSLFDRRFMEAGVFLKAHELGKEIHVRSVFLQGVLCMPSEKLPICLHPLKSALETLHVLCTQYACTPSQAALAWMHYREREALLIFGTESASQVSENTDTVWQKSCNFQDFMAQLDAIRVPQEIHLLNPSFWKI